MRPGPDRLGAGPPQLRVDRRGRAAEAAVRPLLHQAPVGRLRPLRHPRDDQDGARAPGVVAWRCSARSGGRPGGSWRTPRRPQRHDRRRRGLLPGQCVPAPGQPGALVRLREPRRRRTRRACSICSPRRRSRPRSSSSAGSPSGTRTSSRRIAAQRPPRRLAQLLAPAGLRPVAGRVPRRPAPRPRRPRVGRRRAASAASARPATRSPSESLWALDVLIEEGYAYDASIFPIRHDRYGIPDAPRQPHIVTEQGRLAARSAVDGRPHRLARRADRRRLLPPVPVSRDALGHRPDQRGAASPPSSTSIPGRSIPTSRASTRRCRPACATTTISARPRIGSGACCVTSASDRSSPWCWRPRRQPERWRDRRGRPARQPHRRAPGSRRRRWRCGRGRSRAFGSSMPRRSPGCSASGITARCTRTATWSRS